MQIQGYPQFLPQPPARRELPVPPPQDGATAASVADPRPARPVTGEVISAREVPPEPAPLPRIPALRAFAYVQTLDAGEFLDRGGRLDVYA